MKSYSKGASRRSYYLRKILISIRFTVILTITVVVQLHAKTFGQRINVSKRNISVSEIFKIIKIQTGYDVLWQSNTIDPHKKINAHFNNASLQEVMNSCFESENLDISITDQSIVLKRRRYSNALNIEVRQDSLIYNGRVLDENRKPLAGATIRVIGSVKVTKTNGSGNFSIYGPRKGSLQVSYIGYINKEITLTGINNSSVISVQLTIGQNTLGEINVVSNGYQDLPKERATGSFEVVTKEQLQHSTSTDLIKRLEGITTSLNFNNQLQNTNSANRSTRKSTLANLTIRGKNTLEISNTTGNTSGQPLVVIDGIASAYSIDKINPNDVENITILKDAAAASIWGSRASNGVIVVKTKRGSYNKPLNISFNTNFNFSDNFNLFYKKYMSTSDFIDAEIYKFKSEGTIIGAPDLTQAQSPVSPVVTILYKQKTGVISSAEATEQLNILRNHDVRNDYKRYLLRQQYTQSYALGMDGGSNKISYRMSGAYDYTQNNTLMSGLDRLSLNFSTSYKASKKLEIQGNITYNLSRSKDQGALASVSASPTGTYPYAQLLNPDGNPSNYPYLYSPEFVDLLNSSYGDKILDLHYKPLADLKEGYFKTNSQGINLNAGSTYQLNKIIAVNLLYNFNTTFDQQNSYYSKDSFYMRDLITRYTTPSDYIEYDAFGNPISSPFKRQIPLGGMYSPLISSSKNHTLRGQINANKIWNDKHQINAIAGVDISQSYYKSRQEVYYGYDPKTLRSNNQLNYSESLILLFGDPLFGFNDGRIPYSAGGITDQRVRTYSFFSNAAYTYNKKYTVSSSIRKDVSSEFGQGTNKGGTPYYSAGLSWNLTNEEFYNFALLPRLQLRSTFGYNGNVNPRVTSRPLINYSPGANNITNLYSGDIIPQLGITNEKLRPEKTATFNLGIDFGFRNNKIFGSFEYYNKRTTDLLASAPVDPTIGYNNLVFNTATLRSWGTDFTLNSQNLHYGLFNWTTNFLFSYNRVKVLKLYSNAAKTASQLVEGAPSYSEGSDLSRLFAYRWAGLDPVTGDPRGLFNGAPVTISSSALGSSNLVSIGQSAISNARYMGSSVPVYFGSVRNTFSYGALSVTVGFLYKLGYYFRRPQVDLARYNSLYVSKILLGEEYSRRWMKPGDELITNVPSLRFPTSSGRDNFYYQSDINVLKGDHVRLQEINFSYALKAEKWFVKNPRFYANISNLGVVWRANSLGLDPDIADYPIPRAYSFGVSANF